MFIFKKRKKSFIGLIIYFATKGCMIAKTGVTLFIILVVLKMTMRFFLFFDDDPG